MKTVTRSAIVPVLCAVLAGGGASCAGNPLSKGLSNNDTPRMSVDGHDIGFKAADNHVGSECGPTPPPSRPVGNDYVRYMWSTGPTGDYSLMVTFEPKSGGDVGYMSATAPENASYVGGNGTGPTGHSLQMANLSDNRYTVEGQVLDRSDNLHDVKVEFTCIPKNAS